MLRRIYRAIKPVKPSLEESLIQRATHTPRYTACSFEYRGFKLFASDFISVAYQIKEYFGDERMKFTASSTSPLIIDCGANVGISVLYFKQLFPDAKILAFEPDPNISAYFRKNMEVNGVEGVQLEEKAVWKDGKGIRFGVEGADGGSIFYEGEQSIQIPTTRLRDILEQYPAVDLLKLDIEGAEVEVIKDCQDQLTKVKFLFIEYHSWIANRQELDVLLACLESNGFRYYIHSIGNQTDKPFLQVDAYNGMDVQLDIYAVNQA
jgi:FkbM family methyltransferase